MEQQKFSYIAVYSVKLIHDLLLLIFNFCYNYMGVQRKLFLSYMGAFICSSNFLESFKFTKLKSLGNDIVQYICRNETFPATFIWKDVENKLEILFEDRLIVKGILREGKKWSQHLLCALLYARNYEALSFL